MQDHSQAWDDAMLGSVTPVVQVDAWYDGEQIAENLPGVNGQVTADSTRTIVTSASISAAAVDDSIVPTSWDSQLACYGTQLHVRAGIQLPGGGTELMSLGWFRVDSYTTQEQYQPYQQGDSSPAVWVARGSQVPVNCSDLMSLLVDAQFLAPEQPASLTSVITEIQRLAAEVPNVTVADLTGVTDAAIPASITYSQSRSDAITALAGVLACVPRMNGDGALTLVPITPTGSAVWTVSIAYDVLPPVSSWSRVGDRSGFYNAVVVGGTASDGTAIVGIATESTGPLRYAGPFGCVPYNVNDPLATTQSAADATAATRLSQLVAQRVVVIPVVLPCNPALETGDIITLQIASGDGTGETKILTGPVQTIAWPLGVGTMTVGVAVPRADLWSA